MSSHRIDLPTSSDSGQVSAYMVAVSGWPMPQTKANKRSGNICHAGHVQRSCGPHLGLQRLTTYTGFAVIRRRNWPMRPKTISGSHTHARTENRPSCTTEPPMPYAASVRRMFT